jgi:hypothetical protein
MKRHLLVTLLAANASLLAGAELTGRGEVTGYGGGVWVSDGGGTHGLYGGSAGVGASSRALIFFDVAYAPLGGATASFVEPGSGVAVNSSASGKLLDFSGGVKYSLTGSESGKAVPYALFATGIGRASISGTGTARQGNQTITVNLSESISNFAVHGGLGVRLYVGEKWGFQPEFRLGHYFAEGGGGKAMRFTAGVFYHFGK